jgi:sorbitol-specific phosphotransferase system component IIC
MEDVKVFGFSFFGIFQSFAENFNPFISGLISIITLLYVFEKYKALRKNNHKNGEKSESN